MSKHQLPNSQALSRFPLQWLPCRCSLSLIERRSYRNESNLIFFLSEKPIEKHLYRMNSPKKYSSALTALVVILNSVEWPKYCTVENARVIQQNCIHRKEKNNLTVVAYNEWTTAKWHVSMVMSKTRSSTALMLCSYWAKLILLFNRFYAHANK